MGKMQSSVGSCRWCSDLASRSLFSPLANDGSDDGDLQGGMRRAAGSEEMRCLASGDGRGTTAEIK